MESRIPQMSPDGRKPLEEKQEFLKRAKDYLATLKSRKEHEIPSWEFSFMPSVAESDELQRFRSSRFNELSKDPTGSLRRSTRS